MGIKRSVINAMMGMLVSGIVISTGISAEAAPNHAVPSDNTATHSVVINDKGEVELIINRDELKMLAARKRELTEQLRKAFSGVEESTDKDSKVVKDEATGYTFTEMEETMYAKCTVNYRNLPTTDNSEKIGKLTGGQEVKVTGQCVETKWYRIELEDESVVYVSNSYIVKDKSQVAGTSASNSSKTTGSNKTGNATQSGSKTGTAAKSTSDGNSTSGQTQQSTSSGQSSSFVDYLNQQRAAAGLSQVSWDSGMAAEAQKRAEAVVNDFSHNGSGNYLENLYKGGSSSALDWYNAWYNSDGHRATMLNPNLSTVGCAYYEVGGTYYVVFVANEEVPVQSAEEWQESKDQGVADGSITVSEGSEGSGVTVYAQTEGYEGEATEEEQAAADDLLRQMGLIP